MKILSQQTQAAIFFLCFVTCLYSSGNNRKGAKARNNCDLGHFQHFIVQASLIDFRSNVPTSTSSVAQVLQIERITLDS
jgi:hypothetical protein